MDYNKVAREIFALVGPSENITAVTHCMTRLRLVLRERRPDLNDCLKAIEGVMGVYENGEELQIIIGPGKVNHVTDEFQKCMAEATSAVAAPLDNTAAMAAQAEVGDGTKLHAAIRARNATPVKLFFKRVASIFIPLIPAFIACGLITAGLNVVARVEPATTATSLYQLLAVAGNAVFWGMNLFVGYNAAKEFGGTPIIGGVLGAIITHPALANIELGGSQLVPGRGGVIAVLLIAGVAALIEKQVKKLVPEMLDLFLTPLLTVLIAGGLAIFILQPLGGVIADTIGMAATTAVQSGGALAGFILAGLWLPVVMLGVHQAMTPIHVQLLADYGVTILLPILAMAGAGQVGASMAVYFKTKSPRLKKIIAAALPVGIMGVGEPLIYGVTLPLMRPFIAACIGGACGGAVQASFMVGSATLGISGLPLAAATDKLLIYLLGLVVAYVVGFIAAWVIGFEDVVENK